MINVLAIIIQLKFAWNMPRSHVLYLPKTCSTTLLGGFSTVEKNLRDLFIEKKSLCVISLVRTHVGLISRFNRVKTCRA